MTKTLMIFAALLVSAAAFAFENDSDTSLNECNAANEGQIKMYDDGITKTFFVCTNGVWLVQN